MPLRIAYRAIRLVQLHWRHWLLLVSVSCFAVATWPATSCCGDEPDQADEEVQIRLRVEWGYGQARQWNGSLRLSEGSVRDLVVLGWSADAPGCVLLDQDAVRVAHRQQLDYDGFDVTVTGSLESRLLLEFAPHDQPSERRYLEIPLRKLLTSNGLHDSSLDQRSNRLVVRRAPGDRLRVEVEPRSLVFSKGEQVEMEISVYRPGFPLDSDGSLQVKLRRGRQGEDVWSRQWTISELQGAVRADFRPLRFSVPDREGVYQLELEFYRNRSRLIVPLVTSVPDLTRQVQFVVVDSKSSTTSPVEWNTVLKLDPTSKSWWDQFARLTQMEWLFSEDSDATGQGEASRVKHLGREWIDLPPEGWKIYPLAVERVGLPHVLEVDYPDVAAQSLGISILEPNVIGQVGPLGVDSGVEVDAPRQTQDHAIRTHRLVFWPKTPNPMLLITNRRAEESAVYGMIRVRAGPERLPSRGDGGEPQGTKVAPRLLAAFFDKPLFPENFQATQSGVVATAPLDDWVTFYDGGRRLTEYLRYAGYNAAILSVNCEGSTLYPSELVSPTPKYDSGIMLRQAADPHRKDVLEMLFRLFNREGLRLVPAIEFASLLPELERLRLDDNLAPQALVGIDLVRRDGKLWSDVHVPRSGLAPYYNPLDPRVQAAMQNVVDELVDRYAHHPAFAGVALQLGAETFAQFPDDNWGWDQPTRKRFADAVGVEVVSRFQHAPVADAEKSLWLNWRATQLGAFYKTLRTTISHRRENARLFLLGSRMLDYRRVQRELRPQLARRGRRGAAVEKRPPGPQSPGGMQPADRSIRELMLRVGIDAESFQDDGQVVLLRPHRLALQAPLTERSVDLRLAHSAAFSRYFANAAGTGSLLFQEATPLALPALEERSPFGRENTQAWLLAHFSPSDSSNRRRFVHALATLESDTLVTGGWLLPIGQEDALLPFFSTFRALPAREFQDVVPQSGKTPRQPVVVRTLVDQGQTLVYLLNDSAWPVEAHLEFQVPRDCRIRSLGPQRVRPLVLRGARATWSASLEPYDLVAVSLSAKDIEVLGWTVSYAAGLTTALQVELQDLQKRTRIARQRPQLTRVANAGFEQSGTAGELPGWMRSQPTPDDELHAEIDSSYAYAGEKSLYLKHTDRSRRPPILWIRSGPLERPLLGRLKLGVRARIRAGAKQPPLRLAIEAQVNGQPYYRYAWVGANVSDDRFKLDAQWKLFHVPFGKLPLDGLQDLRIGFDLMGPGEVWVDDVQILDTWFSRTELGQLEKDLALARFQLEQGRVLDCQEFLDSYWPRFFKHYVPLVPALQPVRRNQPLEAAEQPAAATAERPVPPWYRRWLPRF
ncbi:MAG: hypothetical protein CMJ75_21475 [Planctomycetaceae bacterium]|nr:hypothetical protein [Planctomycetaceae bacterium]